TDDRVWPMLLRNRRAATAEERQDEAQTTGAYDHSTLFLSSAAPHHSTHPRPEAALTAAPWSRLHSPISRERYTEDAHGRIDPQGRRRRGARAGGGWRRGGTAALTSGRRGRAARAALCHADAEAPAVLPRGMAA